MIDERQTTALLARAADGPSGPSRVDLTRAVRDARRRVRRTRVLTAAGVVAVTAAAAATVPLLSHPRQEASLPAARPTEVPSQGPTAVAQPPLSQVTSCTVAAAPLPDGASGSSSVQAVDVTGTWQAGRAGDQLLVWNAGELSAEFEAPGIKPTVTGVNAAGSAVGYGGLSEDDYTVQVMGGGVSTRAWKWSGGRLFDLQPVTGASAMAINDAGVVAGQRADGESAHAVYWPADSTAARDLPVPAGYGYSAVIDIFPDGRILGMIGTDGRDLETYLWSADHRSGAFVQDDKGDRVAAVAAADGWVFANRPVLLDLDTGTTRSVPVSQMPQPLAVNGAGWLAGGDERSGMVAVYDGRRVTELPTLATGPEAANFVQALSNDGRVLVGQSDNQATIWRCS